MNIHDLDDCLDLFDRLCKHCTRPAPPDLLKYVAPVLPILELPDHEEQGLQILGKLYLLAPEEMNHEVIRKPVLQSVRPLLEKSWKTATVTEAVDVVISIIRSYHQPSRGFSELVEKCLWSIGLFEKVLDSIQGNWESRKSTGPTRNDPPEDWKNESDYFGMLARIIMVDPATFVAVVDCWARSHEESLEGVMPRLLDQWFENMEGFSSPKEHKLGCMALTRLLESVQPWILSKLQQLISLWTSALSLLVEDEEGKATE